MSGDEWQRVRRIFEEALDLPAAEQRTFVAEQCGGDADVRRQVEELLGHEPTEGFLDSPISEGLDDLLEESDLSGKTIGSFRLVRPLGHGGMGAVYLAEQEHPRRHVALKILDGLPSARARRRFEVESELLASLSHPSVAQVYEAGSVEIAALRLPFFAMEYVEEGRTLPEYAHREGLGLRARLELFLQVCDAIQYGHSRGVLHRDLKPGNLLVDKNGRAKVIDFGIARAVGGEAGRTELTSTGEIVGTIAYMAPERLSGVDGGGEVASDVYSLGGVLYELVTGAQALSVSGLSLPEAIRRVTASAISPPRQLTRDVPRELSWIVMRAMAPEPSRRYPTVSAFAEDLRAFLRDEPVAAGPPSALYRLRKYVKRHRVGVSATALVAAVLAVMGVREAANRAEAERLREEAQGNAARILRLKDSSTLELLQEEAEELYPMLPAMIPRYDAWLAEAETIADGLVETERVLADLEGSNVSGSQADVNLWMREELEEHAATLRAFLDPRHGLAADIRRRRGFAATVEERSITGPLARRAWQEALGSISEPRGPYNGLQWEPQLGLLPLGVDPASGLWEFAHLLSGNPAPADDSGSRVPGPDSGIVLVLLPGGPCRVGAERRDPAGGADPPHVDPLASPGEGPVTWMNLDPFLLSKFELTQAQWERVTGERPSRFDESSGFGDSPLRPVESVDWWQARTVLERYELDFPTGVQWEYATRAGTSSPWWMGAAPLDWHCFGNLHQEATVEVGRYEPNWFGFHDLLGNVSEWCRDYGEGKYGRELFATRSSGELDRRQGDESRRAFRGAHFGYQSPGYFVYSTRASLRQQAEPTTRRDYLGLRPARSLY